MRSKNTVGSESFSHPVRRSSRTKIVATTFAKETRLQSANVIIATQRSHPLRHTRITLAKQLAFFTSRHSVYVQCVTIKSFTNARDWDISKRTHRA
jgi:hypothetical protein